MCSNSDYCTFNVDIDSKVNFKKILVLSSITHLIYPLSIIELVITNVKLFLQNLWRQTLNWPEPISPDDDKKLLLTDFVTIELHLFSHATKYAYGVVNPIVFQI